MHDSIRWLRGQLPAMERALEALVLVNSFSGNRAGGLAVGALLDGLFDLPGVAREAVPSERYADHRVYRTAGRAGIPPVALLGHLDTVFPPGLFEGYRAEGNLRHGPGVLDMKGGLVVAAFAVRALAQAGALERVPALRVVVVSDEEVGSPEGAPLLRRELPGCQAALVFESGRMNDAVVTRRKGVGQLTARAAGVAAHAGNAYFDGASAIWALSRFIDGAQRLASPEAGVTVNVGLVSGGTSRNTVPAAASAELDLRFPTAAAEAALLAELQALAGSAAVPGTSLTLHRGPGRPPMEPLPGTAALLERWARCARAQGFEAPEAPLQGGGSDGNTAAALGLPTLDALGPRGRHFHTPQEYLEVDSLVPRASAAAALLLEL
jgi:glutamate carboxypeptidase